MFFSDNKVLINKEKNKKGEEVKVFLSPKYKPIYNSMNHLTCFTKENNLLVLNFRIDKIKSEIFIADILVPKGSNKGYGSVLLKTLLKIALNEEINEINGQLFYDDEEHKKIQINFYEKFGFEISENYYIKKSL